MIIECSKCHRKLDDEFRTTICPHETFAANDGRNNFAHHPEAYLSEPRPNFKRGDRVLCFDSQMWNGKDVGDNSQFWKLATVEDIYLYGNRPVQRWVLDVIFDHRDGVSVAHLLHAVKPVTTPRSASEMVREFHETYDVPILASPAFPSHDRCKLRQDILEEEWIELCEAQAKRDLVEVADALADMLYIIHGTALEYGIPLDAVVEEVHRSNMSKKNPDGSVSRREDGKVMKGVNFTPPDIKSILGL